MRVEPQHAEHLVDQGARLQTDEFILRVHGDRLTGHWPSAGNYDSPPTVQARIEQRPDALMIEGTVRESFNDSIWQPGFLGLTIFMALLALFGVITLITGYASGGLPPLLIGVIAGPIAFLLWRRFKNNRQKGFDRQVRELEAGMRDALTTGSTSRITL